jgi:hypothetical protein
MKSRRHTNRKSVPEQNGKQIRFPEKAFSHPCYISSIPTQTIYPIYVENNHRSNIPKQSELPARPQKRKGRDDSLLPAFVLPVFASDIHARDADGTNIEGANQ